MQTGQNSSHAHSLRERLASNTALRAIALPILRRLDRPITITNPFSGQPFKLLSYTHKGYWFYGKRREQSTMRRLETLIHPNDTVFDVGGHIGFLSQFFAKKVGPSGQVHVFEPGQANQKFLLENLARSPQCIHIDAAVSDTTGKVTFYEENLGGFMNSLDPDFAGSTGVAGNQPTALEVTPRQVNATTLDVYANAHSAWPSVIKIDVEGAELSVLHGARQAMQHARAVMVEVSGHEQEVLDLLLAQGFSVQDPEGAPISDPAQMRGNIFAMRA